LGRRLAGCDRSEDISGWRDGPADPIDTSSVRDDRRRWRRRFSYSPPLRTPVRASREQSIKARGLCKSR
jgi:hypothetical protein